MSDELRICPNCLAPLEEGSVCPKCGFDSSTYTVLPHHLVPGSLVKQRYQVGRVLGEGGFGITYVGRDTVLNLKVAIKEFYMAGYVNRNHEASSTVFATLGTHRDTFTKNKEKFLSEARVLARFYEEPGIVGVRDFCEENGTAYIIMDFLDGVNLKDYLEKNGRLAPADAVALLMPVMRSLQRVHADGIIHRDISPDNIMVLDGCRTKLLDFGAARAVSQTDIKSLSVILKPGYAPEEQYRSKGHQGPWTDVYALAATLYRCIVGEAPDDAMERMYRDLLPAPAATDAACPIAISNVIMKGLAVRQPDRYQDVGTFLTDLEAALQNPENAALAPDVRQVPGGARPAAPAGDRTVLADLPTGQTVLADGVPAAAQPAAPAAAPRKEALHTELADAPAPAAPEPPKPAPAKPEPKPEPKPKPAGPVQEPPKAEPAKPEPKAAKPAPAPEPPKAAPAAAPKSRKKKKPVWLLIVAVVAVIVIVAVACQGGKSGGSAATAPDSTATLPESNAAADTTGSEELPTLTINGVALELPGTLKPLLDAGWVFADTEDETRTLEPDQYRQYVDVMNEYGYITVTLVNQTLNTQPLVDCTVTEISVDKGNLNDNYLNETGNTCEISNGLELGVSVQADAAAACPDGKKKEDEFERTTANSQEKYTFDEYGLLSVVTLRVSNDTLPDTVDTTTFSTERPAEYDDQTFMDAYGMQDFTIHSSSVNGSLPLTLEDLTSAGWTVERQPEYLPTNSDANIYLRYDVRTTLQVRAANYTGNAILPQYGMLRSLSISEKANNSSEYLVLPDLQLLYKGHLWVEMGKTTRQEAKEKAQELGLPLKDNAVGGYEMTLYGDEGRHISLTFNSDEVLNYVNVYGSYDSSLYDYESEGNNP